MAKAKSIKKPAHGKGGKLRKDGRRRGHQHMPKHTPSEQSRATVQALAAMGETHEGIADYLTDMLKTPISARGVARYYPIELKVSKTHQRLVVTQSFYRKAAGSPAQYDSAGNLLRAEQKPETIAQIFWLKAQAGWRDHQVVTIDPNQKPIPVSISSLTDRQLDELEQRLLERVDPQKRLAGPK